MTSAIFFCITLKESNVTAAHCDFPPLGPVGGTVTLKHPGEVFSKCLGQESEIMYRSLGIHDVKDSVCFVLKFVFLPFSPPFPSEKQILKQNKTRTCMGPLTPEIPRHLYYSFIKYPRNYSKNGMFQIQNFKNNDYETPKSCGQVGVRTHSHHWDGANHVAGVDFQVT